RGRGSTGKKMQAMELLEKAFEKIERQTKQNPLQILIKAIENSAPREDTTRFKRGGVAYAQSVDVAPVKRIDEALKNLAIAAFAQSFNKKFSAEDALADELILASQGNVKSFAVKRRDEMERIAKSSR
ncbi:MAG: 30S ribosomal protein S7, partial [Candidatus Diapherotrites archaeon]|nr:30S ribosomal protein S7 [Candidatus Diapherotrites archaeon]